MAKAWWRDSDYALFDRLTKERDEARADVSQLVARVRELEEENVRLSRDAHMWKRTSIALRQYDSAGWMVDELNKLSKERDELYELAHSWRKAGGAP